MKKKYIYVRKTVTWEGRRYEVSGKTEQEALEKLADLKASLKRGEKVVGANSTVDRWFAEWMDVYKRPSGITEKSLDMYSQKYRGYIKPVIGTMRLRDVKEVHLQRILNREEGKSFSHVSKLRLVMQEIFSKARKTRLISYDPSEDLQLPAVSKGKNRSITDEERACILETAKHHRAGLWVQTILYAGLRPGETAALLWKDVDFESNEIHVYKAIENGTNQVKGPKTASGVRDVPIHSALRPLLLAARGEPFDYVFTMTNGQRLTSDGMQRLWKSFVRALDIDMGATLVRNKIVESKVAPDLTAYCLRHTFCTDLQRAGVPINVAKELMGHADISVTANIYTHKNSETLHSNIEKLSKWEKEECGKNSGKKEGDTA